MTTMFKGELSQAKLATDDQMPIILMALDAANEIALDTETTGIDVRNGRDYLTGVCYATDLGDSGYIPFRHNTANVQRKWVGSLIEVIEHKPISWHNMKFDYHSLKTLGVNPLDLQGPQYDTLLIATLVDEELPSKELDWLAKRFLNESKEDHIKDLGAIYGWGNIPPEVIYQYGAKDAILTGRLRDKLWQLLTRQPKLESVYWDRELPFNKLLYEMEQRGVGVNTELASTMAERGRNRMATIHRHFGFNPASPVDLGRYLLDELKLPVLARTPKGKPSFNKRAMEEYDDILQASNDPSAKLIAEFRGWQKATTALYEPLLEKVGPDGRIRTNFNQHRTVTGRLSASDPNLQQVPRGSSKPWNGNAKACFTSGRDGYLLYGWDYSQVELRLAAAYGREQVLLSEFAKDDADPFNVLCTIIFGKFTPELRHETKTFVYANLYGAGLPKIAAQLGRSVEETRPLYNNYRRGIAGISGVSDQVKELIERQGYVSYWDGRRRHMKNKSDSYKAWNSLVQGGGAQLMKTAMLRCKEFESDDCYMVLSVHDEITFIVKEEAKPDYEPLIVKAMTDFPEFGVNFAVDGKEWK